MQVHSKLRNGGPKGRASRNSSVSNINISTNTVTNTPSTSPTTFSAPRPEKRRKSKDESPSPFNGNSVQSSVGSSNSNNNTATLNSQPPAVKKSKNVTSPCAISPVLLECPEQDCSKKYKHANGLKYHQSHAHGIISTADDDSLTAPDSPSQRSQSPPTARPCEKVPIDASFSQKLNYESGKVPSDSKLNILAPHIHEPPVQIKMHSAPTISSGEHPLALASGDNNSLMDSNSSNPFAEAILKPNASMSTTSTPTKQEAQNKSKFVICKASIALTNHLLLYS